MLESILGAVAGFAICKLLSNAGDLFGGLFTSTTPGQGRVFTTSAPAGFAKGARGGPLSSPPPIPPSVISPPPQGGLIVTSTAAPFPSVMPAGLPPFPSGWTPAKPLTSSIIQRAQVLLQTLHTGERKTEQTDDGRWITYLKTKSGTRVSVIAFQPKPGLAPS